MPTHVEKVLDGHSTETAQNHRFKTLVARQIQDNGPTPHSETTGGHELARYYVLLGKGNVRDSVASTVQGGTNMTQGVSTRTIGNRSFTSVLWVRVPLGRLLITPKHSDARKQWMGYLKGRNVLSRV